MHGSKNHKMDIDFLKFLYEDQKKVEFLHVKQDEFSQLYASMKVLSKEVNTYYEHEDDLIELLIAIRKGVNKFFTSIENYQNIIDSDLNSLIRYLSEIKMKYEELFKIYGSPIVKSLISIKQQYNDMNFLVEELRPYLNPKRKQCIVVRYESTIEAIKDVPVIKASKYLRLGEFYEEAFFIGSPDFYDNRFSQLFLANRTYFITYEFFQNKIKRVKRFKLLKKSEQIDTLFQNVSIARGNTGEVASIDFGEIQQEILSTDEILLRHEKNAKYAKIYEQVEAKLVLLENKYYTFIPLKTKIRTIDKDKLAITNRTINEINIGDWILFRNNSNSDLVIDVANRILGEKHKIYRKYQILWKTRLESAIDSNGIDKVIRVFQKKGIKQSNLINIHNWLSPTNIRTNNFEQLLLALKFKEDDVQRILDATEALNRAHLKAGREITSELIKELNEDKVEEIIEHGYATFTSPLMPGASFNIETVKEVVDGTVTVNRADTLTIWRD